MNVIHYIGLDVQKKSISYCIKDSRRPNRSGAQTEGRATLRSWAEGLREPYCGRCNVHIPVAECSSDFSPEGFGNQHRKCTHTTRGAIN